MLDLGMTFDTSELERKFRRIHRIFDGNEPHMRAAFRDIGLSVSGTARDNAPRSMTTGQYKRTLKTAMGRRDSVFHGQPGGLERSIEYRVHGSEWVDILVPINSRAGKYASIIHDEKGSVWEIRGDGTVAKGGQADDLFIERAIEAHQDETKRRIEHALGEVIKEPTS